MEGQGVVTHRECGICKEVYQSDKEHFEKMLKEIDKRYEQRFAGQEAATMAALKSAQMAVDKAETNAERWRSNANEWRAAMNDKDLLFMPRNEANTRLDAIDNELTGLRTIRDIAIGKASQNSVIVAYAISIISLILGAIQLFK